MTVESNNAFYMLPKPETFKSWAERTPDDFVMAVKVNRYITHIRRLRDCAEPAARFLEHCRHLARSSARSCSSFLRTSKPTSRTSARRSTPLGTGRVAVEFRHESSFTDETRAPLEEPERGALHGELRNYRPIARRGERRTGAI